MILKDRQCSPAFSATRLHRTPSKGLLIRNPAFPAYDDEKVWICKFVETAMRESFVIVDAGVVGWACALKVLPLCGTRLPDVLTPMSL
jgi:hypothetical protein